MAKPFKAHDVAALSRALKRPIRPHEIASGKLDKPTDTPYDAEIAAAEKRLADKQIAAMPQAERDLHFAKQSREQYLGKQADAATLAEHQKKVAPRVAELKKLQAAAANDPAYNTFDRTAIEKCLSFYEVGSSQPSLNDYAHPAIGDEQVAEALYSGVVEIVKVRNAAKTETLQAKRNELERQRISIETELATLNPSKPATEPATRPAVDPKFAELEAAYATADLSTREGRAIAHKYLDARSASYETSDSAAT